MTTAPQNRYPAYDAFSSNATRRQPVDVRIGVQYSPKEIEVDLGDGVDVDAVHKELEKVLSDSNGVLKLTDKKGRKVIVPASKVAYVEIGAEGTERRMGFIG